MEDKYLNSRQACSYLGIKELNTIYSYIHDGIKAKGGKIVRLKASKIGGNGNNKRHWIVKQSDLEAFILGQEAKPAHAESTD